MTFFAIFNLFESVWVGAITASKIPLQGASNSTWCQVPWHLKSLWGKIKIHIEDIFLQSFGSELFWGRIWIRIQVLALRRIWIQTDLGDDSNGKGSKFWPIFFFKVWKSVQRFISYDDIDSLRTDRQTDKQTNKQT